MPTRERYYRKIIRIKAEDSPNVRIALAEIRDGKQPSGECYIPGVLPYHEYAKRRQTWDKVRQCIGLDAEFYEGAEVLLFPPEWLNLSERRAREIQGPRKAVAIGIDPAEGGDKTAMAAVDHLGLIELISKQTPDTSVITGEAIAFLEKHGVPPDRVVFDRGGGGKEHADRLRTQGYPVRSIGFGETSTIEHKRELTPENRLEQKESRSAYKNRRAELYGRLRELLDPSSRGESQVFAIPQEYVQLRQQLAVIPLSYDDAGRLYLLPKHAREGGGETLDRLIGHSPDEADALVLAIYGLQLPVKKTPAIVW